jgi:ATP-dependent DNA helicase RecG
VRCFAGASEPARKQLLAAPLRWPRPSVLDRSIATIRGIGPKRAEAAAEAGIETIGDLLFHVPHRHRVRTVEPLAAVEPGREATVLVEVLGVKPSAFRRRGLSIVSVKVGDDSESAKATWFNQPWVAQKLTRGTWLLLSGSKDRRGFRVAEYEFVGSGPAVRAGGEGTGWGLHLTFSPRRLTLSPGGQGEKVQDVPPPPGPLGSGGRARKPTPAARVGEMEAAPATHGTGLVPVHPATARLKPQRIRKWVEQAVDWAGDAIEPLPAEVRVRRGLAGVGDAIRAVHFPESEEEVEEARKRLVFEELFLYQAILAARKRAHRVARPAPRLAAAGEPVGRWIESLPFEPTGDQLRAFEEIDADLGSGQPMQRLLMGEVGSGKTVVALYAMLRALEAGFQAVLMAPTETLAEQHAATLGRLLAEDAIPFALLTGATPARRRKEALERLATGELGLVVGTHALIEPAVGFARLALCVVDEQHRFGVEQRRALDSKGVEGMAPHVLHMTATPIPRTLALTAYGDLDTTALRELPPGRQPVETRVVEVGERPGAYELVREQLRRGRQAYVVCPLVEESERMRGKAAEMEAARLAAGELRGFSVGAVHGQMPSARRAEAMDGFAAGATDVLVATTVIEVGIDVPNATVMLIEGAERYGISQLHQLRGRVGRGGHRSHCLLFPEDAAGMAGRRLRAVEMESDGFRLAEVDLVLRGEGEVLGTRQHGLPRFGVAVLPEDTPTLIAAREEVLTLLRRHAGLDAPQLGPLLEAARRRFGAGAADALPL